MFKTHKIELKPNNKQANFLAKSCGTARFGYNMALDLWNKQYLAGNKPNMYLVNKEINKLKPEWCYEVSKCCVESAVHDLGQAFTNFFKNPKHFKHPTFKKKGKKDSFTLNYEHFSIKNKYLKVAKLPSKLKLTQSLRFEGKLISCTISRRANKWFASIAVEVVEQPKSLNNREPRFVGVDLGVKTLVVTSDGVCFSNIKPHKNKLKRLRMLNKSLSRKVIGSSNFKKAKTKLATLHYRIANIRKDYLHKVTTELVRENDVITIEDLNTKGLLKNRKLSRSISDASFGMFKGLLEYKCAWNNVILIKADRFYPSTKTCSSCGNIQDIKLGQETYKCNKCEVVIDRDYNAAINLNNYGRKSIPDLGTKGFGLVSSGISSADTKLTRVKKQSTSRSLTLHKN